MAISGRIHSTESCATVDGPGIRFLVFMQGCLMRCLYCHNRDSWDTDAGREVTVAELMPELLSYRPFMRASGGGITVSGGEPLLQMPFVTELFEACKAEGLHTCLDTNGFVHHHDAALDRLLDSTDLVLLDLKHIRDEQHIPLTQVSNRFALALARYLAERGQAMWIRHVVVPGWSDDEADIDALGRFIASLGPAVEKVELLPYHNLGSHKWASFGQAYPLEGLMPPGTEKMAALKAIMERHHPNVSV
ncbi:pyruvate formate lyase-activating enzyme 1 [Zobellella denitrificans]|uniref:Pyruvate formate-lyase-activating enzyme n=1 Tax=Zobellella denitrificans TaxID=347534 RepID=A0A291HM03_9GAMM|nr:pyruvate formate lyase 1-activating protein [Zobellella denitrificans]ATG73155.1 pyruvate formate lyase-activating enzyme 1 [Zobellella denitrificans]